MYSFFLTIKLSVSECVKDRCVCVRERERENWSVWVCVCWCVWVINISMKLSTAPILKPFRTIWRKIFPYVIYILYIYIHICHSTSIFRLDVGTRMPKRKFRYDYTRGKEELPTKYIFICIHVWRAIKKLKSVLPLQHPYIWWF